MSSNIFICCNLDVLSSICVFLNKRETLNFLSTCQDIYLYQTDDLFKNILSMRLIDMQLKSGHYKWNISYFNLWKHLPLITVKYSKMSLNLTYEIYIKSLLKSLPDLLIFSISRGIIPMSKYITGMKLLLNIKTCSPLYLETGVPLDIENIKMFNILITVFDKRDPWYIELILLYLKYDYIIIINKEIYDEDGKIIKYLIKSNKTSLVFKIKEKLNIKYRFIYEIYQNIKSIELLKYYSENIKETYNIDNITKKDYLKMSILLQHKAKCNHLEHVLSNLIRYKEIKCNDIIMILDNQNVTRISNSLYKRIYFSCRIKLVSYALDKFKVLSDRNIKYNQYNQLKQYNTI